MKVYLCGPIMNKTDDECKGWRAIATKALPDVLDPMRRDFRGNERHNAFKIVSGDKEDIRKSDVVLAMCEEPSWGTAMEIMYAQSIGLMVVSVCSKATRSPWVTYHSVTVLDDLDSAIEFIRGLK